MTDDSQGTWIGTMLYRYILKGDLIRFYCYQAMDNWHIVETEFHPEKLHSQETVFTIGNGYLGTRGTFEEGYPGELAATLINGVFDTAPIVHSELANTPNWISLHLFANGEKFSLEKDIQSYKRVLDMGDGSLERWVRWKLSSGEGLEIHTVRFASLADEHLLVVRIQIQSIGFSGPLELRAGLSGHTENAGLLHWNWQGQGQASPQSAYLHLRTRSTQVDLFEYFYLGIVNKEDVQYDYWDSLWSPEFVARLSIKPGEKVVADKLVVVYTSQDTQNPNEAAREDIKRFIDLGYSSLQAANQSAWNRDWERCNVTIQGDDDADRSLRFNVFQLLIAAPRHNDRVSIPAKALSGFGYHGHIFWDTEIFILPFFTYTLPEIARNLLLYRYHTLPAAREKAESYGYEGAMFAWESARTGDEVTPPWLPGPAGKELVRIWTGEIEQHISADIVYAVYQYWLVTGDDEFLTDYGAEMILDVARFWGSRAEWNSASGRFVISDVVGPDEYHEHVNNNAYTNELARWTLKTALQVWGWLQVYAPEKASQIGKDLDLSKQRLNHWQDVIDHLFSNFNPTNQLYEQFDGYFSLQNIDLHSFEPRKRSMQAVLGIKPIQKYQVIKQPDVLMLLYLIGEDGDKQSLLANYEYYTPQTDISYGSSLGPAIQALLSARLGYLDIAYQEFMHSIHIDLLDTRGNTPEGIHAATAGGVWQACCFGFAGLGLSREGLKVQPRLPTRWQRLKFPIEYHGMLYTFDLRKQEKGERIPSLPLRGVIISSESILSPANNSTSTHLRSGARALIEAIKANGFKVALVTDNQSEDSLPELSLDGLIDKVIPSQNMNTPEGIMQVASQTGLLPEQSVILAKNSTVVAASLEAGTWVVGVGLVEKVGAAQVSVDNLEEATWEMVIEQIRHTQILSNEQSLALLREPES